MKQSEMTNEQIADAIESAFCASSSPFGATMREAAARLRRPTPVDDYLLKMARDVDKLRAKLKVAEDAPRTCAGDRYCNHQCACRDALAAIREPVTDCNQLEGGAE